MLNIYRSIDRMRLTFRFRKIFCITLKTRAEYQFYIIILHISFMFFPLISNTTRLFLLF